MSDRDLIAIGFVADDAGTLYAPADSRVKLAPIGNFYECAHLRNGNRGMLAVRKYLWFALIAAVSVCSARRRKIVADRRCGPGPLAVRSPS